MIRNRLLAPILFLSLFPLPSCENSEAQYVRDAWQEFNDAVDAGNGKAAVALLSSNVFARYDAWLEAARPLTRAELDTMEAVARNEIIKMRHRIPGQLAGLEGKSYLEHAITQGWYARPEGDRPPHLGQMTFKGDTASVNILLRTEPSEHFYDFILENDTWKLNEVPAEEFFNEDIAKAVKAEHSTENNLIMRWESHATGDMVKHSIWDPPR